MPTSTRPNILWFITDDTGDEMLGYAGGDVLTPTIDRIAREGVVCTDYHCSSPACTPSRYSYLTGMFAGRCPSPRFAGEKRPDRPYNVGFNVDLLPGQPNIAALFRDHGYVTGFTGKWHAGPPRTTFNGHTFEADNDPDDPEVARKLREDYAAMQAQLRGVGFEFAEAIAWGNTDNRPLELLRYHNLEWHTDAALRFLDQVARDDRPFFLNMATTTMHGPHHVKSLETDGRETEAGLLDKMPDVQPSRQSVFDRLEQARLPVDHKTAGALWMDDAFGVVMDRLDELGLAENTIVIWSTDHGMGTRGSKFTCYQGGVRIPYCMKWPGRIPAQSTCEALLENVDFLPTIARAAGIEVPGSYRLDGLDRLDQLCGKAADDRDDLYFEWGCTRAVRTRRYKYLAFRPTQELIERMKGDPDGLAVSMAGKFGPDYPMHQHPHYFDADQLYDLGDDPDEQRNLAGDPSYAAILADQQRRLQRYLETFPEPFELDAVDSFLGSEEHRRLIARNLADRRLWEFYFYKEKAY